MVQVVELFRMVQVEHVRHFPGRFLEYISLTGWSGALCAGRETEEEWTSEIGWDVELLTRHGKKATRGSATHQL